MGVVVTKLLLTIQTDVETGETKLLSREVINDDIPKAKKTAKKTNENPEPIVTLDSNKLCLTTGAVELLKVCDDCRVDVKYDKTGTPIIGTNSAFGTTGGNLLTKSNTVSFRGKANDRLSEFGTVFKLESTDREGIYKMVGDKAPKDNTVPEEIVDINKELDDLDNLDILDDNEQNFDFTL